MLTELQQKDIKALEDEITRIANETEFNDYYKCLYELEEYYHNQIR